MSKIPDISTNRQLHSSGQHEEKNTMSVNQSSNPTNLQEALCHDVIVLCCDCIQPQSDRIPSRGY